MSRAHQAIRTCLDAFTICTVDKSVLEQAYLLSGKDFEDDLQIACAVLSNVDAIITRNTADFGHATIPVFTPSDWIAQYT